MGISSGQDAASRQSAPRGLARCGGVKAVTLMSGSSVGVADLAADFMVKLA